MADVCLTAPSVLSPFSPNESRKRRHGYSDAGDGCGGAWFKRHRTGSSFARRLLHLRGFSVDVRQAEELVRFIDQLPQEMDKDVSNILEKCGDIEDAIRQLTSLKLTFQQSVEEGGRAASDASAGADVAPSETNAPGSDAEAARTAAGAAGGSGGVRAPTPTSENTHTLPGASAGAPDGPPASGCVLSQEWVTALVQEMSSSANVPDAHVRATRVLQAFEAAVRGAVAGGGGGAGDAGGEGGSAAKAHADNLARENVILKRAVAIQNARQQDHGQLQLQVAELQRVCAQYQHQLQQAQRQNYSLSLHLKEAMSPSPGSFNRNPDVF